MASDILHWPVVGPFLRWRWSRAVLQGVLLLIALVMVYDGFLGPPEPYRNLATTLAWVYYRGLLILALLGLGNVFCMACPFAIPRSLARRFGRGSRRWPRRLRTKWVAAAALFAIFLLYEWLDLWASPLWTAWTILAYFAFAFVLEAAFRESPFCKYVCPLGHFNYLHAALSPTQIQVRDPDLCRTCEGKECLKGSSRVSGCGTLLFVPQIRSNLDCTLCLDCARACPYDNVAWRWRLPWRELADLRSWPARWDLAFLAFLLLAAGLSNAFGMVPPMYRLLDQLTAWGITGTLTQLLLVFGVLNLLLPYGAARLLGGWTARQAGGGSWKHHAARLAPALIPLSFGIWAAHYGFHFVSTAWVLWPTVQAFARAHGWDLGEPMWHPVYLLPRAWWFPLQAAIVLLAAGGTLALLHHRARKAYPHVSTRTLLLPWVLLVLMVAWLALVLFSLPMEMRGAPMMGH